MNREDFQQIKKIFQSSLDLIPAERVAFLNEKCSGKPHLRREVEKLLESYKSDYLEQPAVEEFADRIITGGLEAGHGIGHYRVVEKLGSGGMGDVYLAEDSTLGRRVAVKVLPEEFTGDPERIRRFVREAKFVSALNHPNIVTIHEIGEADGQQFIVSEYIEGETLREHMKRERLSLISALEIALRIASALETAHGAGIVHRDIKPDNIMIRPDSRVKVLDFGVAKLIEQARKAGDTQTTAAVGTNPGMIIGTANYMSPEQARGEETDERTDIFNFGIVLYEMLSGERAFEGTNTMDVIGAILHKEPRPLSGITPELPEAVERIVNKALTKDRSERYQTAKDLLAELKEAKQELEFQEKLHSSDVANRVSSAGFVPTEARRHRRGFAFASLFVLLIAALGFGYWYYASRTAPAKQIDSIAVMPFVNDSGNPDAEYLSDGLTETLISRLSRLSDLNVKPRSTVFRYKGKDTDLKTIGEELNVEAILKGRVIQRGEQFTLSVELIDVRNDKVLWSEQYQRKQTDLVSLQIEIAKVVSTKLKPKLSGADETIVTKTETADPAAYQAYLKGRYYWNRRTSENIKKAIEQFKVATDRDPNYALAFVGLADCYAVLSEYSGIPPSELLPQSKAYAEQAIAIDGQLAEAHASLGLINRNMWQWEESEREFKRAIELKPTYATAYHWYSILLKDLGRFDEAATMIKRAHELNPLSNVININIAKMYQLQNDHNASIESARKLIELDPTYPSSYGILGLSYLKQGRNSEAIESLEKAVELSRNSYFANDLGYVYGVTGKRSKAIAIVKELEEKYAKKEIGAVEIAIVYLGLGDKDKAFEWLEKGFQNKEEVGDIRWETHFESLRNDPRSKDLLRRLNLPE